MPRLACQQSKDPQLDNYAVLSALEVLSSEVPSSEVAVSVSASFVLIELAKKGLVVKSFQALIPSGPKGVAVNYLKKGEAAERVVKERQLGEVYYKKELTLIVLIIAYERTEALLQVLVIDFGLTVSLKVCGGAKGQFNAEDLIKFFLKLGPKPGSEAGPHGLTKEMSEKKMGPSSVALVAMAGTPSGRVFTSVLS
ncbi:hypothetical protein MBM_00412 [Drepanopeziza brunnea f. sp. 'multigermtubi' MB_m1]|uniref:Uncharacterized protein n=1 Tax=Marssonina brunnea f. sp. multigermtubi (strain MB_m1) TaxID=1072389 RepID=K1Y836_MARBU|nr:uncharacterized protein MBM_00412 [Drepanopeziza brunnea f. sp. 'multigermtubi' MB_m1]EKD21299.1 hypothetical protein MBM_00412 [Drepanopeziza brunnea f. sp. 'multigermtubi' MB_m1]